MGPQKSERHLLADTEGIGPPMAPKGWKWRGGKRATDTYFTTPDGKQCFRSRRALKVYLCGLPTGDAPPAEAFVWDVTEAFMRRHGLGGRQSAIIKHPIANASTTTRKQAEKDESLKGRHPKRKRGGDGQVSTSSNTSDDPKLGKASLELCGTNEAATLDS